MALHWSTNGRPRIDWPMVGLFLLLCMASVMYALAVYGAGHLLGVWE